jgi:hypothetical protein
MILKQEWDAFDLLHGKYETEEFPVDLKDHAVPDFGWNVINRQGNLYNPRVDIEHLNSEGNRPQWPNDNSFAVCLTHDLDNVVEYSLKQSGRDLRQSLSHRLCDRGPRSGNRLVALSLYDLLQSMVPSEDTSVNIERWLEFEQSMGVKSTFFVLASPQNPYHYTDPAYRLNDKVSFDERTCAVSEVLQQIDTRGWEVGLHPTWNSFDNIAEMRRQKQEIECVIDSDIVSVRQHHLHHDPNITPRVQAQAGLKYDCTLGFNKNVGFRRGSSYPWRSYAEIIEVPLVVQDTALLREKGLNASPEMAFKYVKML